MRTGHKTIEPAGRLLWGLALSAAVAAAGIWTATLPGVAHWGFSALTMAIVLGIVVGNTVFPRLAGACAPGVDFSRTTLLRLGIILFGFRVTFQQLGAIGWKGMLIDALIIATTFTLALQLGTRLLGLDRETAMLIGAGSAICGAAAVLATEPVVRGQPHKVSVAVATVVIFGTAGMFLYPLLYAHLPLSEAAYGLYAGSTIHEVAQVVVAGRAISESAAETAVIEKMLRVMMLAPFLLLLGSGMRRGAQEAGYGGLRRGPSGGNGAVRTRVTIPWFAVLFIVASGVHSLGWLPAPWVTGLLQIDTVLLAMAMAALGLRTHAGAIRQAGFRPILLGMALFGFLVIGGYWINQGVAALG